MAEHRTKEESILSQRTKAELAVPWRAQGLTPGIRIVYPSNSCNGYLVL